MEEGRKDDGTPARHTTRDQDEMDEKLLDILKRGNQVTRNHLYHHDTKIIVRCYV